MSLILLLGMLPQARAQEQKINVVFDMHGVTNDGWEPTPKMDELLSALFGNPRYRVMFYSTQRESDIRSELRRLRLRDGRVVADFAEVYGGSRMANLDFVNSFEPDTSIPQTPAEAELQRKKNEYYGQVFKDLRAIVPMEELANTILIDDSYGKAHPGQIANLFWLREGLGYVSVEAPQPPSQASGEADRTHNKPEKKNGLLGRARSFWDKLVGVPDPSELRPQEISPPSPPVPVIVNKRADLMAGMIDAITELVDQRQMSASAALSTIQWGRVLQAWENPAGSKLDDPSVVRALIARGEKYRKSFSIGGSIGGSQGKTCALAFSARP